MDCLDLECKLCGARSTCDKLHAELIPLTDKTYFFLLFVNIREIEHCENIEIFLKLITKFLLTTLAKIFEF